MLKEWINLDKTTPTGCVAIQSFYASLYKSRVRPIEDANNVFGDLRSLIQQGFTGGEDWASDLMKNHKHS